MPVTEAISETGTHFPAHTKALYIHRNTPALITERINEKPVSFCVPKQKKCLLNKHNGDKLLDLVFFIILLLLLLSFRFTKHKQ